MRRTSSSRLLIGLLLVLLVAVVVWPSPAATASPAQQGVSLTLYNAQHVPLAEAWVADFTKTTGINVQIRSGKDLELAQVLVQEGENSPADVFITENSPAMSVVSNAGLFAPVNGETLNQVPPQYSSPRGDWTGIAARTTVFVYNTSTVPAGSLPVSLMDLADPSWKDRFGIAPAGADFQAVVSAVLQLKGPEATEAWLAGLKANARVYSGNRAIMAAANKGEIDGGVIYHYYCTATAPSLAPTARTWTCTTSAARIPVASSACRAAASSSRASTRPRPRCSSRTSPVRRGSSCWPTATPWSTPSAATCRPTRRSSRSASLTRRSSTSRSSTPQR